MYIHIPSPAWHFVVRAADIYQLPVYGYLYQEETCVPADTPAYPNMYPTATFVYTTKYLHTLSRFPGRIATGLVLTAVLFSFSSSCSWPVVCHQLSWGVWVTLIGFLVMIKPIREAIPMFMLQFNGLDRPEVS